MKCTQINCSGTINLNDPINLRTSCHDFTPAYACSICGRIHWEGGSAVFNRLGHRAFLINNGIVHKDKKDQVVDYSQ